MISHSQEDRLITHSAVMPISIPIVVPFAIAKETLLQAEPVIVAIKDAAGRIGLGECAPFPTLTLDNQTLAAQVAGDLLSPLHGLPPNLALERLRQSRKEFFKVSKTAYVGVETALFDLIARQNHISMSLFFGLADQTTVATDITLPIMGAAYVKEFWSLFRSHRFRTVKIKVSGNVSADLDLIHALRQSAGSEVAISLDGNQGFDLPSALALARQLAASGITPLCFEQPLPQDDWSGLAKLSQHLEFPVCLDESVQSPSDLLRVIHEKTARMINLKIMKSGIEETVQMLHIARASGISLMLGGMLESEIAMGTSLQMAAGTGAVTLIDLDTPFFLTERLTQKSAWHLQSADLEVSREPGHGMVLLESVANCLAWK